MKTIIYCRVSTKEQAEKGFSLEAQEKACREFAFNNGLEVDKVFIERGESAKTQNRSELQKLIKYAIENKKSITSVVIWKYDRLTRQLSDQMELVKQFSSSGIRVLSVTENNEDNSVGKLMRNIIGSFAQYENDVKSERTINGMRQAVQQGRWCWRAPFGYKRSIDDTEKSLIVPAEDSKFVIDAFNLFETGLYKQTDLIPKLKKLGFKKPTKSLINRILTNPLYAGLIQCKWIPEYIEAIHKPIISKETFFKVQQILAGKRPTITPRARNHPDFPLRRFLRCPKCDQKLTAGWSTGRKGVRYAYYHCRTKNCSLNVKKHDLEAKFYDHLLSFKPREDILDLFEAIVLNAWETAQSEQIKAEYKIEQDLKSLKEEQNKLEELVMKGTFNDKTYKRRSEDLENKILVKQVELNEVKIELNDIEGCLNYCKHFISNLAKLWANADVNLKQRFQSLIFPDKIYYEN